MTRTHPDARQEMTRTLKTGLRPRIMGVVLVIMCQPNAVTGKWSNTPLPVSQALLVWTVKRKRRGLFLRGWISARRAWLIERERKGGRPEVVLLIATEMTPADGKTRPTSIAFLSAGQLIFRCVYLCSCTHQQGERGGATDEGIAHQASIAGVLHMSSSRA